MIFGFLGDDFANSYDLFSTCLILQKQIDCIDGKKENITVPSVVLKRLRELEQEANTQQQPNHELNTNAMETSGSTDSVNQEEPVVKTEVKNAETVKKVKEEQKTGSNETSPENLCVLCLEEQRRLACIPCGHLATCVPCGHSLRSCPICRTAIDAFVRIYL